MTRRLLHPLSVSMHSIWHREHVPGDRGFTDIDVTKMPRDEITGFPEHRTGGYRGRAEDNKGLLAVRRLNARCGFGEIEIVEDICGHGYYDTRHFLWLVYLGNPPDPIALYTTAGNPSPLSFRAPLPLCIEPRLISLAEAIGIEYRSMVVNADGRPVRLEDIRWLVDLPKRYRAS